MTSGYQILTRPQYTFVTNYYDLSTILTQNVSSGLDVNVVGIFFINVSDNLLLVKIVVGTADTGSNNIAQNDRFKQILNCNNIIYSEQTIIQITNIESVAEIPGQFRIPYTLLICRNIPVRAFYTGEPTPNNIISTFIEVSYDDLSSAVHLIKNFNIKNADTTLCVNVCNVDPCPNRGKVVHRCSRLK